MQENWGRIDVLFRLAIYENNVEESAEECSFTNVYSCYDLQSDVLGR